jgi:hypothetical protein
VQEPAIQLENVRASDAFFQPVAASRESPVSVQTIKENWQETEPPSNIVRLPA